MFHNPFLILTTPWFLSAFLAWNIAGLCKMLSAVILGRGFDIDYLVSTGGMPSAHSATVSALFVSIGLTEGFDTPAAMIALTYAIITMFDAASVRRAAGNQARVLNIMIQELFKQHRLCHTHLKELLGHTRTEVFAGMLLGIAVACAVVSVTLAHR